MERIFSGRCAVAWRVQHIVEEAVLLIPHADAVVAQVIDRIGDVKEVLPELARHVFVGRIFFGEFECDRQQIEAVHRHPAGAVGLFEVPAGGQWRAAVENADVVETEEASLEHVASFGIFSVYPPGEVEKQLVEDALEEHSVANAPALLFDLVNAPGRPGVHRRVHVAKSPLVRRKLPVGVHVPLAHHQHELLFGEIGVHQRQRHAVKGEIPRRVPRVFPLIRHGNHVGVVEMSPFPIAAVLALARAA